MNIEQILAAFKSPQAALTFVSTLVGVLGTVGILAAPLAGAVQTLLTAVLGVLVVLGHQFGTVKLVRRAHRVAGK